MIVSDQIVVRLGRALGAPVSEVCLVDVPAELIAAEPQMNHMEPGLAHATLFVEDCSDRLGVDHVSEPQNRPRFALLAVLYGWVGSGDDQFIYENQPPHLVYSVDHGHFFPGQTGWTIASLESASSAALDGTILGACSFTEDELIEAKKRLETIDDNVIARAVAAPPSAWGIQDDERVALCVYLSRRRDDLLKSAEQ